MTGVFLRRMKSIRPILRPISTLKIITSPLLVLQPLDTRVVLNSSRKASSYSFITQQTETETETETDRGKEKEQYKLETAYKNLKANELSFFAQTKLFGLERCLPNIDEDGHFTPWSMEYLDNAVQLSSLLYPTDDVNIPKEYKTVTVIVKEKVAEEKSLQTSSSKETEIKTVQPTTTIKQPEEEEKTGMELSSVLRKRKLKMNKHKHKKLRKRTRALRKRLNQ